MNEIEQLKAENEELRDLLSAAWNLAADANRAITTWDEGKAQWTACKEEAAVNLARLHLGTITKNLKAHANLRREALIDECIEILRTAKPHEVRSRIEALKKVGE